MLDEILGEFDKVKENDMTTKKKIADTIKNLKDELSNYEKVLVDRNQMETVRKTLFNLRTNQQQKVRMFLIGYQIAT